MTRIAFDSPVTRETATQFRNLPVVVSLHPSYMTFRLKGTRTSYSLPYDAAYTCAAKLWQRDNAPVSKPKRRRSLALAKPATRATRPRRRK